ncbi:MAG: hypothetical protein H8E16_02120 [Flavobacteriales bacterium]|nr:hypothetical protein [Flavobacteriales bacterium]
MNKTLGIVVIVSILLSGCKSEPTQEEMDQEVVQGQQAQYAKGQPVPAFNWSLERDNIIKLYKLRNEKVSTHTVWRSDYGMVEGDCPSLGYGIPYDTSLTNPYQALWRGGSQSGRASAVVGQAEPNGVFASTNTAATWIMCIGMAGNIEPHYVESKVTTYPGPVKVNYETNRVSRNGKSEIKF